MTHSPAAATYGRTKESILYERGGLCFGDGCAAALANVVLRGLARGVDAEDDVDGGHGHRIAVWCRTALVGRRHDEASFNRGNASLADRVRFRSRLRVRLDLGQ